MFFILAKTLGFFAQPDNLSLALGLVGLTLVATGRFTRLGRGLTGLSLVLLLLFGLSPLGNVLIRPLEERFPRADLNAGPPPTGFIVLGGAIDTRLSTARAEPELLDAAERMTVVAELARRFPQARIVFSGGSGDLTAMIWSEVAEASVAKRLFESFGIAPGRLGFEDRSRDTYENAQMTSDLVKPTADQRWLLVTSGYHMPRAMALFRKAGFAIEAYPVDFRTASPSDIVRPFYSMNDGLRQSDLAVREWVGLIAYRLSGRIDEFFPAPHPE